MSLLLRERKKLIITTLLFVLGAGVFVFALHGGDAHAGFAEDILNGISNFFEGILNSITRLIGMIMFKLVILLVWVGQYNEFIAAPVVTKGWVLARDVMNMFFVIVLLVIAIATILQKKELAYQ